MWGFATVIGVRGPCFMSRPAVATPQLPAETKLEGRHIEYKATNDCGDKIRPNAMFGQRLRLSLKHEGAKCAAPASCMAPQDNGRRVYY
jgi:hypothetical protein